MNVLKIYTLNEDGTSKPFPNEYEQAEFDDYEYTASRMGGAPSITAKIKHRLCLDNLWTEKQYVEFRDCKYFVRDTPSSSKDNTDTRYDHDITFLHERFVLENVYMLDSVFTDEDNPDAQPETDKYVSNSTKVIFWGDINEFVGRFNACLYAAGLGGSEKSGGFYVVVDEGVTSEELLVSFEDKFFSEALQEIFNTFKLPYYWVGRCCHIGLAPEECAEVFEYGAENSLLSIEKQNTNQGYCNRATGVGSSDNIPYYYPRTTSPDYTIPHAVEGNKGITDDNKIEVIDATKFDRLEAGTPQGKPWEGFGIIYDGYEDSALYDCTDIKLRCLKDAEILSSLGYDFSEQQYLFDLALLKNQINDECFEYVSVFGSGDTILTDAFCNPLDDVHNRTKSMMGKVRRKKPISDEDFAQMALQNSPRKFSFLYHFTKKKDGNFCKITFPIGSFWGDLAVEVIWNSIQLFFSDAVGNILGVPSYASIIPVSSPEYDANGRRLFSIKIFDLSGLDDFWLKLEYEPRNQYVYLPNDDDIKKDIRENYPDDRRIYVNNKVNTGYLYNAGSYAGGAQGSYEYIYHGYYVPPPPCTRLDWVSLGWTRDVPYAWEWGSFAASIAKSSARNKVSVCVPRVSPIESCWHKVGKLVITDYNRTLEDFGLSATQTPQDGDRIVRLYVLDEIGNIPTQPTLMPTIYRDTKGKESFYNALNEDSLAKDELYAKYDSFYEDAKGENYVFEHEFLQENPRETKYNFPDIKPTIEGIEGINGALNIIAAVDYDDNDHDYLKGEALYETNEDYADELASDSEYDHPYFFVKIRRTAVSGEDGYGFNLFDSVTENDMTLSLKSGDCGGCTFRIMVTEDKKNPVITDGKGNLVKDGYGRVRLLGAKNQGSYKLDETQQNTKLNDVWLCLEKETDTYGMLMPNVSSNFRPKAAEKFVLLNINLPILYIKEAEARLSRAIIEQMWKDNSEKFSFNINFSRIYFSENPAIMKVLDENSKVYVRYNGLTIPLYVNSYTYKVSSGNILPEIEIDLKDEISIGTTYTQNRQSDISAPISAIMGGMGGANIPVITTEDNITNPSDGNVYSALRTNRDFVYKTKEDYIQALMHFMQGLFVEKGIFADFANILKDTTIGDYKQGLVGALSGVKILPDGTISARRIQLEDSLVVPDIEYNKAMVLYGIFVVSPAVGEIEEVNFEPLTNSENARLYHAVNEDGQRLYKTKDGSLSVIELDGEIVTTEKNTGHPLYERTGKAKLKLTEGEYPSIEVNDMLLGFWHNFNDGMTANRDGRWNPIEGCYDHNGDYTMAGFSSVYFRVTKIDENDPSKFEYVIRSEDDKDWHANSHPSKGMKFFGFGNMSDEHKDRQSIYIITRDYSVRLIDKKTWTYDANNVVEIHGKLDGFSMLAKNQKGEVYTKRFSGYGNVMGNAYIFGQIDQFERVAYKMEIDTGGDNFIGGGETKTITCKIIDGYGLEITDSVVEWKVERTTSDQVEDEQWNFKHSDFNGVLEITLADIGFTDRVTFRFTAVMPDREETMAILEI